MNTKEIILSSLGIRLKDLFIKIPEHEFKRIQEIRLRVNKPIMIVKDGEFYLLHPTGI